MKRPYFCDKFNMLRFKVIAVLNMRWLIDDVSSRSCRESRGNHLLETRKIGLAVIAICYWKSILAEFLVLNNNEHPLSLQEDAIEKLADYRVLPDCLGRFDANHWTRAFTYRIFRFRWRPLLGLAHKAYSRVSC